MLFEQSFFKTQPLSYHTGTDAAHGHSLSTWHALPQEPVCRD